MKTLEKYIQETIDRKKRELQKVNKGFSSMEFTAYVQGFTDGIGELERALKSYQALQAEQDERQTTFL